MVAQNEHVEEMPRSSNRPVSDRIRRIQHRYQSGKAFISIERARYYTESWKATAGKEIPRAVRISMAMKNVFQNMTYYVDQDDRIAGHWTEFFLGIPIDIERGVFNKVLESELTKKTILLHRGRSVGKGLKYLVQKRSLKEFVQNQKLTKANGAPPLDMGFDTMSERKINPYQIRKPDLDMLLKKLLPYWKGRTVVDKVESQLVQSDLYSKDMHDFAIALPGNTSRQVVMLSTCSTLSAYQGHLTLDYERILKEGLVGIKEEIERRIDSLEGDQDDRQAVYRSFKIAIEGIEVYSERLRRALEIRLERETDKARKAVLEKMISNCRNVPQKPATSFREAVQSIWTIKTAVELAHPVNLLCFGRLDQVLYPYYKEDIKAGRIDPDAALELLEELLLKIMSQNIRPESNILGNFYQRFLGSSPVTVAGVKPDGEDATNELTYLFLEAAHRSKAITNMSVRIGPDTPVDVLFRVAEYLSEGTSSFSIFNDQTHIEAMKKRGFLLEDARDYSIMGCVETTCPGKTGSMSANALQLSRLMDIVCRNGDSRILAGLIREEGLHTGDPDSFKNFDEFLDAFIKQAAFFIDKIVSGSNLRDRIFAEHLPAPCLSVFVDGCAKNGRDITAGGAKYNLAGISMINSIANMIDSIYVIKKLIFEQKVFSFEELLKAVDNNFVGYENVRSKIDKLPGKWGNGNPEVDELAGKVSKALFDLTYKYRTFCDGPFVVYIISMITHTLDGRLSIAGLDGRRASTPYAASCNPSNVERSGSTATLRSVAGLPFDDVMGAAVNMKFHPSAIGANAESRKKWVSLIRTYFKLGGSQLQPTVASAQTLKNAQHNPEEYRELIVKVGGYSTYFVDLGREIQDEIIARTEHN